MTTTNPYDEVPYRTIATPTTHPDRMATIGTLFGLSPVPATRCRVLEIGCGNANNLIPMAFSLPESSFVGIDLAGSAIEAGKAFAAPLGLRNLTLLQTDLMAVGPDLGTFDYIIAHGLYAWVPPPVQDKLLAVCRENLSPHGIAYVSYNTYPAGYIRKMVREMVLYLIGSVEDPVEREKRARSVLRNLAPVRPLMSEYGKVIAGGAAKLLEFRRESLLHDALADHYAPTYFHRFAEHAAAHRLRYVGEAEYWEMDDRILQPEDDEAIRAVPGDPRIAREQYIDFLNAKVFRQTLLCRAEVAVQPQPSHTALEKLFVTTRAHPTSKPVKVDSPDEVEFRTAEGVSMKTGHGSVKRILAALDVAWPHSIPYRDLPVEGISGTECADFILGLYGSWLVELSAGPPSFVRTPGPRPSTTRLARLQLEQRDLVTSQRHMEVRMDGETTKALIRLLDGSRDRAALLRELKTIDPQMTMESLEAGLQKLADLALLIS
jgi:SAM-dependent methyltransferase